jgi:cell division protein FtsW (lipid II flippase)
MKEVPYALIRLAAGGVATAWCIWVFVSQGRVLETFLGLVLFGAGWVAARHFAEPLGKRKAPPWLDTALPIALASLAILPAALYPFLGNISLTVAVAIVVMFLAGMSLSLGLGPYANQKVGLKAKWLS